MRKILVVEDDGFTRKSVVRLLEQEGFAAISAANGIEGLHLALSEKPDLILCDLMMPDLDGFEVLSRLQQDTSTATIPFICLTAKDERAVLRRVMELGGNDYLTKPFSRAELLGAIAAQMGKKQLIEQQQLSAVHDAIAKLNDLVYYDSVTNLPNRLFLRERFQSAIAGDLPEGTSVAVGVLSLNRLEDFNRTLGTDCCDLLVEQVIERVLPWVGDRGTVARLNSEQLVLIFSPALERAQLVERADNLLEIFSRPLSVMDYELSLSSNLGIALYPEDGRKFDGLLDRASATLQQARQGRGNCWSFYSSEAEEKSYQRLMLEMHLRQALDRNEFDVHYQPQVDLATGRAVGAEALVRWHHPESGTISPARFVPIAERTGSIVPLGEWVLRTACEQARLWRDTGFDISVAVNLSAVQFEQPDICDRIVRVLDATGLEPSALELELTEGTMVRDPDAAIAIFKQLKTLGIRMSIDDFGTGYSSLSYLPRFPMDTIKIDRSFVSDMEKNPKNASIVMAIVQLAHRLGASAIAEGIETEAQRNLLQQQGCDLGQGYFFQRPMPATEFWQWLQQWQHAANARSS